MLIINQVVGCPCFASGTR